MASLCFPQAGQEVRVKAVMAAVAAPEASGAHGRRDAPAMGEATALQTVFANSPRMRAQQQALQAMQVARAVPVIQRLSTASSKLVHAVDDALKQLRALVTTDLAAEHFGEDYDFDRIAGALDSTRSELARLRAAGLIEDRTPSSLHLLTDGEPAYLSGETLVLADGIHDMALAHQAAVVADLLGGGGVSERLIEFVTQFQGKQAADDKECFELQAGAKVYRVAKAASVRSYVLSGISRVENSEHWTELGNGFYTSPDREGAAIYADQVGKPAALMELSLARPASCRLFRNTSETNGKSEQKILDEFGASEAVCDAALSQIKFHNPFYREALAISAVWTQNEASAWVAYDSPQAFVAAYEQFLIRRHQQEAHKLQPLPPPPAVVLHVDDLPQPSVPLREAKDASVADIEAIAFIEAALAFEKALGVFLATYGPAEAAAEQLARAVWQAVSPSKQAKLGSKQGTVSGMVGAEPSVLRQVVESGNLRERLTLVYNGYVAGLFGRLERPESFQALREQRSDLPKDQVRGPPHPEQVNPPLSQREWFAAVGGKGKLGWESGQDLYHFPMTSDYQKQAEDLLTPVSTGPSGTAYGIYQVAQKLKVQVDAGTLRLALLGWMLPIGDHSFHEIMTACATFDDQLAYDATRLARYRSLTPLQEDQLRALAPSKLFPDEVATLARQRALQRS